MGNSLSNQIQDTNNIEISKDEYNKYQEYLIEKQKNLKNLEKTQQNNKQNTEKQFNKYKYNSKQENNRELSQYEIDKKQNKYQQSGKNIINNKISDYQINLDTGFKLNDKNNVIANNNLYKKEINNKETYLPRFNSYINDKKDSINIFEKKINDLDRDRKTENVTQFYENIDLKIKNDLFEYEIDYSVLDPFKILKKKNIPLEQLKIAYKKLSLVHHPDKGGDINEFNKLINAYNYIEKVIKIKENDKSHLELKNNYNESINNEKEKINSLKEPNIKDKFNINKFNKVFNETLLTNPYDEGYSKIMIESNKNREDIEIENKIGKFTKKKFINNSENDKKKKTSNYVVKYTPPEPVNIGKLFYSELGENNVNNFTSRTQSMNLTDYKEAHIDNLMIDPNKINYKKYKNIEDLEKDREILKMSQDQIEAIEENDEQKKIYEWNRINKLRERDNEISKQFDRTNKLYLK